jgi:peptidyl-prolyl cis-trans isomerase SurA
MSRKSLWAAIAFAALAVIQGCKQSPPTNVAATVNGRPITYADLDKQFQVQFPASTERPNDDQVQIQKLELLRTMIDNEIMLQRAEKANLLATDADVDTKLNEMRAPYTQEEFQKQLAARKMSLNDLKADLRQQLSVDKLFNKEITSYINITDKDVEDFYNANRGSFNLVEPQIHFAQILVSPAPDPAVHNLKNSKAQNDPEAQKKIENLMMRVQQGEDFGQLARGYSEDPSAETGGDLGYVGQSALDKTNPELRKMLLSIPPGQVSGIIKTAEGYRILKVISKEPAGQRQLNDPRVQQTIREKLLNRKDQLLKLAYYEVARTEAKVNNYLAASLTPSQEKKKQ